MHHLFRRVLPFSFALVLALSAIFTEQSSGAAQASSDPFEVLRGATGSALMVPPRALAVIPERHTGRLIRVVDQLVRIEPQFDDLARGLGLSSLVAIQLRTREANIPIFVAKTDATISTVLQLRLGSPVEASGLLIERGGRFLMLASDVRAADRSASRDR